MTVTLHPSVAPARPLPMDDDYLRTLHALWNRCCVGVVSDAEATMLVYAIGPILEELMARRAEAAARSAGRPGTVIALGAA